MNFLAIIPDSHGSNILHLNADRVGTTQCHGQVQVAVLQTVMRIVKDDQDIGRR